MHGHDDGRDALLSAADAMVTRPRLGPLKGHRGLVALLVVAAAVLGAYSAGVVQLPQPEELITRIGGTLGGWTYVVVGALTFLEAGAFIGLIAPGEVAVVFGGVIAGRGEIDLLPLIAVVWIAALVGDCTSYGFGRVFGRGWALEHGARFGITPARFEWVEGYVASHGGKTILIGRFVGIVRALAPFVAGASRMPLRRFAVVDTVGTGLWASTFSLLGFMSWRSVDDAFELARHGTLGLALFLGFALALVVSYRLIRGQRRRSREETFG